MDMIDNVTRARIRPGLWPNADMVGVRARAHECQVMCLENLCTGLNLVKDKYCL